jgi:DNA-binding transcriptional LysR family regulator
MELRHLLYFKTVAEELHFRKAAEKLFMAQPPLSRQIKELEEELGAQLLERNNKRVLLTNAGKYFKAEVDDIFSKLEEAKNRVKQMDKNISGELRIGYISSVYQPQLSGVLKKMKTVFPFVKTNLFEAPSIKQIDALEKGRLDVGILRAPVHSEKLQQHSLFFDSFVVITPKAFEKYSNQQELATLLKQKPFIFFNQHYAPVYYGKLIEICERMGFRPTIDHEANNVHSILQLVEAGLGVSIIPQTLKKQYAGMDVNFIPLKNIPVTTEVVLAFRKSNSSQVIDWFIKEYERKVK